MDIDVTPFRRAGRRADRRRVRRRAGSRQDKICTGGRAARSIAAMEKGYGQFCPVAKAAEVFAERWTPLVLRELFAGATLFNEIHKGVPLMSRTLLAQRLRELEADGIVACGPKLGGRGHVYRLTPAGEAFLPLLEALSLWGQTWGQARLADGDCDPGLLIWAIRRHADRAMLPERRLTARFDLRNVPRGRTALQRWWLVLARDDVDVCIKDPGYEVDVLVTADVAAFTRVWMGYAPLDAAKAQGLVAIEGDRGAVARFVRVIGLPSTPCLRSFAYAPKGRAAA
jgi:DNA-binding HxlR family transcriptional regulator